MADSQYDVVVAGAGPSGSVTAYRLARAGAKVLLLDRAKFPRIKPCGGGVTARCYAESPIDLTPVIERTMHRVRFSFRLGQAFDFDYPETLVYMTQRQKLDAYLAEHAVAAGAEFFDDCALRSVTQDGAGVEVEMETGTKVLARVLVGADGANGIVARSASLHPVSEPPVALEANFPYIGSAEPSEWDGLLALDLGIMPGGYGWSFPKGDHFNVGCGGWHDQGPHLRKHLANLRSFYRLDENAIVNIKGHHLPTRTPGAPIVRDRVLLVGDAAGLVDPMSGEGLFSAFVSARLAAEAIGGYFEGKEPDLLSYEAAIDRDVMTDMHAASLLRDAYHYSPTLCYFMMRRSDLFRRMLCELLVGKKTYINFLKDLGPAAIALRFWAGRGRAARKAALTA